MVLQGDYSRCYPNRGVALVGIYLKNGVLDETAENQGISYALDHLLYEKLAQTIEDAGIGVVRAATQYGYSGFQVLCRPEAVGSIQKLALDTLTDSNLETNGLADWIQERKQWAARIPVSAENLYYAMRIPGTALGQSLSRALGQAPDCQALQQWHAKYYTPEAFFVCAEKAGPIPPCNRIQYAPTGIALPKHIPWRRSQLLLAFNCPLDADNLWAGEALCRWLTPKLAALANSRSARLMRVEICPDFVSELRILLQCERGKERTLAEDTEEFLANAAFSASEERLNRLRREVFRTYACIRNYPLEWNRLMGEMAMLYGRQADELLSFSYFEQQITQEKLQHILASVQNCTCPAVFATAVR